MSTNSSIAIMYNNGKIESAYCHWNGDISYNGFVLEAYYDSPEKVKDLISEGMISVLGKYCTKPEGHTFDKPVENYTIYYGRDRGDERCGSNKDINMSDWLFGRGEEYNYIYSEKKQKWYLAEEKDGEIELVDLLMLLKDKVPNRYNEIKEIRKPIEEKQELDDCLKKSKRKSAMKV